MQIYQFFPQVSPHWSVRIPSTGKKAAKKLGDVEEEEEEDIPDLEGEEEGEKENEDLCNEGGTPAPKPKRKRKRKNEQSASTMGPHDKKNKADEKSSEQGMAAFCYICFLFQRPMQPIWGC